MSGYDEAQAWQDNYDGMFARWAECDTERLRLKESLQDADLRLRVLTEQACDHEAQIRDLLEEREELLTEIVRLQRGNHPAGRALPHLALAEALTERDAEHEGGA